MQIILRNRTNDRIQIERWQGQYWIDTQLLENRPMRNSDILTELRRGDCVTQLPLEREPENLWIVERVENSDIHGLVIHMFNGSRIYVGNLPTPALYFQFSMLG